MLDSHRCPGRLLEHLCLFLGANCDISGCWLTSPCRRMQNLLNPAHLMSCRCQVVGMHGGPLGKACRYPTSPCHARGGFHLCKVPHDQSYWILPKPEPKGTQSPEEAILRSSALQRSISKRPGSLGSKKALPAHAPRYLPTYLGWLTIHGRDPSSPAFSQLTRLQGHRWQHRQESWQFSYLLRLPPSLGSWVVPGA